MIIGLGRGLTYILSSQTVTLESVIVQACWHGLYCKIDVFTHETYT